MEGFLLKNNMFNKPTHKEKLASVKFKDVLLLIESEYKKDLEQFIIHKWRIIKCPNNYSINNVTFDAEWIGNIQITLEQKSFLEKSFGVKQIIKHYGIYWCLVF